MRSRYTAFVVGDARYLEETWHPGTRPAELELSPSLRWTGLEIVDVVAGGEGDTRGVVEFRAHWREGAASGRARGAEPVRPAERALVVPRRPGLGQARTGRHEALVSVLRR